MSLRGKDGSSLLDHVRPHLGWSHVDPARRARLDTILGTMEDDLFPGGIIPRLASKKMKYYAVAASHAQRQRLSSLLRASVGRTITDFSGQLSPFSAEDALEKLLIENGHFQGLCFTAGGDGQRGRYASASLERLHRLVNEGGSVSANELREKLYHAFGLDRERPHQLDGFQTRLAVRAALHNFCIWLNRQLGRPSLAFADLLGW